MKRTAYLFVFILSLSSLTAGAQQITYSAYNGEDNRDINFEILGRMNDHYVIYKNIRWKHVLAFYDNDMNIAKSTRLSFIPEKTFNIDFIAYPDHFFMIYRYQKNNIVYCMGVNMDANGKKLAEPIVLDTTKLGLLADNKIYNVTYSQDKKRILLYKMQYKNQQVTIVTKLYDASLAMLDSARMNAEYDERKDAYSDMFVSNDGNIVFAKYAMTNFRKKIKGMEVYSLKPGEKEFGSRPIAFEEKYFDDVMIKIDNLNKQYVISSLYYDRQGGNIAGIFNAVVDGRNTEVKKLSFSTFADSLRSQISDGLYRSAFDNLVLQQVIVKKDGGFIITSEDHYVQERYGSNFSSWDRNNLFSNSPFISNSDYYYYSNPSYGGYYRPLNRFSNVQSIRYYYDNILVMSFDSSLVLQWAKILPKKQSDDDNDNFLSYSTMNVGSEIHFIYIEEDRNKQVISNQGLQPDGRFNRYPTLKSRESGFEFMPRLAKQVGYKELIIPCVIRGNIAFARIVFID